MYTLNLYKSTFELNTTHSDKAGFQALWNSSEVRDYLHRDNQGKPLYLLHDGPPYANGSLHLGHFVNKSLKDTLLKFKRLDGYFAPFVPGFDCHGLPVELEVEKTGLKKTDPQAFVQACSDYAKSQVALQEKEFQDFGVNADWEQKYRTLDSSFEYSAAKYFMSLPQREKRLRPVHWCSKCGSSLAEAEVEYKSKQSDSVVVLFQDVSQPLRYLQVWTTTPYTLPANKAVAYSAAATYVEVPQPDGRLFVRAERPGEEGVYSVATLAGMKVVSPYTKVVVPVVAADYVSSAGTGLVHLAPSFGVDDFRAGEAHGLVAEAYVDEHGKFLAEPLKGLTLAQAGEVVLESLGELLFSREALTHEYPHCWRHKSPLFFKASEEWFLNLSDVGTQALAELDKVTFFPATGRERLGAMLKTRTSWCVSRTRLWGTPLVDPENSEDVKLLEQVPEQGLSAWHSAGPRRTLDVWFDSGATHAMVLKARFGQTADVYLEGSDQHRGWFQSSLLTAVAAGGPAPFKALVTHGFVVDEQGKKYSKSSKNYQPLDKLFTQHSPDVLRLWALSQDYTKDLKLSKESLARTVERYRKVRNTVRFCLQNTPDFAKSQEVPLKHALHKAQMAEMFTLVQRVREAQETFDFAKAVTLLMQFCESTSSDYFTAFKDTLYCEAADAPARREVQTVLLTLLEVLVRVLTPLLPYTAEESYTAFKDKLPVQQASSQQLSWSELSWPSTNELQEYQVLRDHVGELKTLKQRLNQYLEVHKEDEQGTPLKSCAQLDVQAEVPDKFTPVEVQDYLGCASFVQSSSALSVSPTKLVVCPRCREHRQLFTTLCQRCEDVEKSSPTVTA